LPNLFFNGLLFTSVTFISNFTSAFYLVILLQMGYMLAMMIKAVRTKQDTAMLMYVAVCVYVLSINLDILHFSGFGGFYNNNMFLSGNIAVIIAMSFVQARQQAAAHKKLIRYNQNLLEADRLKDKIMTTEIAFLHAQIKPHFLYNALDAIANICETDGKKASKLIIDLAIYLRGSLAFNHLNKTTTIERELELVETYFHIEQARFGDKIQLVKTIDAPLHLLIPVLVLQPLVENAVRHGISKRSSGGVVSIAIVDGQDHILMTVYDDGVGMSEQKVEKIFEIDESKESLQGVGMINIHHRLCKMFGSGLNVVSREGEGTTVSFAIPKGAVVRER